MHLFYQPGIKEKVNYLSEEESHHCVKVLRHRVGDVIQIVDGKGSFYEAKIILADSSKCTFSISSERPEIKKKFKIHLYIAPTKNPDRMEWMVEKCVEIGVDDITFINCQHSERAFIKTERLAKKAVGAMKQSLSAKLPNLHPIKDFKDAVSDVSGNFEKYIAYVDENHSFHLKDKALLAKNYAVLIGPEGDFSSNEIDLAIQKDFQPVSLGNSRLRTETAGIVACIILNLINE